MGNRIEAFEIMSRRQIVIVLRHGHGLQTPMELDGAWYVLMEIADSSPRWDAVIFQVLQWLLDYAPPRLHLAFASRTALPLSFARLRSQGLVSEFDLRFTAEETERFLREQLASIDSATCRCCTSSLRIPANVTGDSGPARNRSR